MLAACGAPGSDSVFSQTGSKSAPAGSVTVTPSRPAMPRYETRPHGGYYRRVGDDPQFQPCGTREPLALFGPPSAMLALKERFRWNAVWEGTKMFAVLQGAIVTDTPKTAAAESAASGRPRTRFFMISIDSLRVWRAGDCGGMRIP